MNTCLWQAGCLAAVALALLQPSTLAQTAATEVSGVQTGTWTLEGSPYHVVGDVVVPANATLAIEPGVVVVAQGCYGITVDHGTLQAVGSPQARSCSAQTSPTLGGAESGLKKRRTIACFQDASSNMSTGQAR